MNLLCYETGNKKEKNLTSRKKCIKRQTKDLIDISYGEHTGNRYLENVPWHLSLGKQKSELK